MRVHTHMSLCHRMNRAYANASPFLLRKRPNEATMFEALAEPIRPAAIISEGLYSRDCVLGSIEIRLPCFLGLHFVGPLPTRQHRLRLRLP